MSTVKFIVSQIKRYSILLFGCANIFEQIETDRMK